MRKLLAVALVSACATTVDGPDAEPTVPTQAPPPTTASVDGFGLQDTDGPVPGLAGFTYLRSTDATRCGGIAVAVVRDASVQAPAHDAELVALLALEFPKNLDFQRAREQAMNTFSTWLEDTKAQAGAATNVYEAQIKSTSDVAVQIAAYARLAQVMRHFASLLVRAEIPADIRTGDNAEEKIDAYCEALAQAADPLLVRAKESGANCRKLASGVPDGWWTPVCSL
jgi:hypothetical protein